MAAISLGLVSTFLPVKTMAFQKFSAKLVPSRLCVFRSASISAAAKRTTVTKSGQPTGIMKPTRVSPEMQSFIGGVPEIPRTQALKEIWAHIKQHNLQDPANKKVIICDEKLKKIFGGRDQVGFLEIAGLISRHFLK